MPALLARHIAGNQEVACRNAKAIMDEYSDEQLATVATNLAVLGSEQRLYLANTHCRAMVRQWIGEVFIESSIRGTEHLRGAINSGNTVLLCNHQSYIDTTATDAVLFWHGHGDIANRIVAVAGPKVYEDPFRRVATSALNTLPVPQSSKLGHTEQLGRRELARLAIVSLQTAYDVINDGYCLLLYPEGARTRTGRLGSFLQATYRYLKIPGTSAVPMAIVGTKDIMPVGEHHLHPGPVSLRFAPPLVVGNATSAKEVLQEAHAAIAALLPEDQRPLADQPKLF